MQSRPRRDRHVRPAAAATAAGRRAVLGQAMGAARCDSAGGADVAVRGSGPLARVAQSFPVARGVISPVEVAFRDYLDDAVVPADLADRGRVAGHRRALYAGGG